MCLCVFLHKRRHKVVAAQTKRIITTTTTRTVVIVRPNKGKMSELMYEFLFTSPLPTWFTEFYLKGGKKDKVGRILKVPLPIFYCMLMLGINIPQCCYASAFAFPCFMWASAVIDLWNILKDVIAMAINVWAPWLCSVIAPGNSILFLIFFTLHQM